MFCFLLLNWWTIQWISSHFMLPFLNFLIGRALQLMSLANRCYLGYCFESLATEDPRRADGEGIHHVDANVEFCSVIKTKLGAHRILMGAEMDCCDSTNDGKRYYVELKTSYEVDIVPAGYCYTLIPAFIFPFKQHLCWLNDMNVSLFMMQLNYHTEEKFEREKLLKFWVHLLSFVISFYAFHLHMFLFHFCDMILTRPLFLLADSVIPGRCSIYCRRIQVIVNIALYHYTIYDLPQYCANQFRKSLFQLIETNCPLPLDIPDNENLYRQNASNLC